MSRKRLIELVAEDIDAQNKLNENQKKHIDDIILNNKLYAKRVAKNVVLHNKVNEIQQMLIKACNKSKYEQIKFIGVLFLTLTLTIYINAVILSNNEMVLIKYNDSTESVLNIQMNSDNKLEYKMLRANIETREHYINIDDFGWIRDNIGIKDNSYEISNELVTIDDKLTLNQLDLTRDTLYIQYTNKNNTAGKEMLVSSTKKSSLNISDIEKISSRFFQNSNSLQIRAYTNSLDNALIMFTEKIAGGELSNKSLKENISKFESKTTCCNKNSTTDKTMLKLRDIGYIDLTAIEEIKDYVEITYSRKDDILRVHNSSDDTDYIYITYIDNENIGCYKNNLIATTQDGLYITADYDNIKSRLYKTFAIKTDNDLYVIKLNNEYGESLENQIFKQLGFSTDIEIKKIQKTLI